MGWGHRYKCDNCGKTGDIYCDYGMTYPEECEATYEKAKNGQYGDEWKLCVAEYPQGAFDCVWEIYKCSGCGFWKNDSRKNYYVSANQMRIRKRYITGLNKQLLRCVKQFQHKCPQCNGIMHCIELEKEVLNCVECGSKIRIEFDQFIWD